MKLEVSQLTKRFGTQTVLHGIDLALVDAGAVALIGPSGGGKSTLLRIVAGLEYPDEGRVRLDDEEVPFADETALRAHRKRLGVVFQAFNLFPHLDALQNIALPLHVVHKLDRGAAMTRAEELLLRFRLQDHGHKKPAALSGGQKQRVAIARAVAARPRVLLLDEPTSALDPEMTVEVLEMIEELRADGAQFLIVTHELGFARRVADRVVLLAEGRIAAAGIPEEVLDHPPNEAARAFLGRVLRF